MRCLGVVSLSGTIGRKKGTVLGSESEGLKTGLTDAVDRELFGLSCWIVTCS